MKAAITPKYGTPDVLSMTEVSRPEVGNHDVLVEVRASVVTQGDRRLRAADFPGISWLPGRLMMGLFRPKNPVPGTAFAGRVVAVGKAVTRFAEGDDVFGGCMHGAHAEYLAVPEDSPIAPMPRDLDYAEAAAVPYGAITALVFLRDIAKVQAGERVLVIGASGGVGRFGVQLAHHLGADVTGVCSRDHDLVRDLGAGRVIDYTKEDFTDNGERYDVIFDTTLDNNFRRSCGSLTSRGRYLSLHMSASLLFQMGLTALTASRGGPRALSGVAMGDPKQMEAVRELVDEGALRPVIAKSFPLEGLADAHVFLEEGRARGSVVIEVGETRRPGAAEGFRLDPPRSPAATRRARAGSRRPRTHPSLPTPAAPSHGTAVTPRRGVRP